MQMLLTISPLTWNSINSCTVEHLSMSATLADPAEVGATKTVCGKSFFLN
jgi:hypothetical protein